ncbi:hypothetical protein RintRC_7257 [Richelia intracellularis]|nr:hypothetical protein RintRC_7257 [Richelia intracellularis]
MILNKFTLKLPRAVEQFEHLIAAMSLMLTLLFWILFT